MGKTHLCFGVASLVGAITSSAVAGITHPGFCIAVASNGTQTPFLQAGDYGSYTQNSQTEWFYQGFSNTIIPATLSWAYLVDPDPFITGTFTLTNETSETRDYVVDFLLPISPVLNDGSYIAGQVSGTLTDANGSGAASLTSIGGGPVYSALADGLTVNSLMANANQSVTSMYGTQSFSGGSFGYPIGSLAGPAVLESIGIRFAFNLSAGDSVSFSSIFVANPIPAPSALGLFMCVALRGRRRR